MAPQLRQPPPKPKPRLKDEPIDNSEHDTYKRWMGKKKDRLIAEAESRKLSTQGTKDKLTSRIMAFDANPENSQLPKPVKKVRRQPTAKASPSPTRSTRLHPSSGTAPTSAAVVKTKPAKGATSTTAKPDSGTGTATSGTSSHTQPAGGTKATSAKPTASETSTAQPRKSRIQSAGATSTIAESYSGTARPSISSHTQAAGGTKATAAKANSSGTGSVKPRKRRPRTMTSIYNPFVGGALSKGLKSPATSSTTAATGKRTHASAADDDQASAAGPSTKRPKRTQHGLPDDDKDDDKQDSDGNVSVGAASQSTTTEATAAKVSSKPTEVVKVLYNQNLEWAQARHDRSVKAILVLDPNGKEAQDAANLCSEMIQHFMGRSNPPVNPTTLSRGIREHVLVLAYSRAKEAKTKKSELLEHAIESMGEYVRRESEVANRTRTSVCWQKKKDS